MQDYIQWKVFQWPIAIAPGDCLPSTLALFAKLQQPKMQQVVLENHIATSADGHKSVDPPKDFPLMPVIIWRPNVRRC